MKRTFAWIVTTAFISCLLQAQDIPPTAIAGEGEEWEYQLIFSDEFDGPNGSAPDSAKWHSSTRYSSTWNRWIADSLAVAYIQNGSLLCRAIPNRKRTEDNVPMITGAMESRNRFSFTYGKVEVRLRTNLHKGNFPAAWMMPQPPCEGWPRAGEIDIFESINDEGVAYHTVHSHWTYNLGHRNEPQHSFSEKVDVDKWHIYGLEWTETALTWTVDGKVVGTYEKSNDTEALAQGQWPFDHPFYLILNQSVGDGSWAKAADTEFTYKTFFDYVRVYQRVPTGFRAIPAESALNADPSAPIFDLCGRPVQSPTRPGLYFSKGHKFIVR